MTVNMGVYSTDISEQFESTFVGFCNRAIPTDLTLGPSISRVAKPDTKLLLNNLEVWVTVYSTDFSRPFRSSPA